ncbi:MAG: sugar ABC transporter substrate-binding protein, partial [Candidatus Micrarchaeia archaeon]
LAGKFHELYPNIVVEVVGLPWTGMYDKILTTLQTEAAPDVVDVAVAWNIPYAQLGLLTPLDDYATTLDLSDFYKATLDTATWKGKLYGIPFRTEVGALGYNKTIFKESGLDPEKPPKTWDEAYEYGKKITVPGVKYFYSAGLGEKMHAVYEFLPLLWGNGGDILDAEYKKAVFNSDAGVEALDFLAKLYKEGLLPRDSISMSRDDMFSNYFLTGKAAAHLMGLYGLPTIKEKNPELYKNLGIAPYWKQPKGFEQYIQIGGWNRVIPIKSKNKEIAWKFVEFLSTPENQAYYTHTFPARKSGLKYKNAYGIDYRDPYVQ